MSKGLDYSFSRPGTSAITAAGYTFVCRYLAPFASGKTITPGEIASLKAAGLDLVLVFEGGAQNALLGFNQGVIDAKEALNMVTGTGIPNDVPLFFAVDFEPKTSDLPTVGEYFSGVASILTLARTGVYGGYLTVMYCFDQNLVSYAWQTYAWSGGQWDGRALLRQIQNGVTFNNAAVDIDEAMDENFGQWKLNQPNENTMDISVLKGYVVQPMQVDGLPAVSARINLPSPEVATELGVDITQAKIVPPIAGIDATDSYDLYNKLLQVTAERDQALQEVTACQQTNTLLNETISQLKSDTVVTPTTGLGGTTPAPQPTIGTVNNSPFIVSIVKFISKLFTK